MRIVAQKPGARLLRVALLMILYKLMFGDEEARPDQVVLTYRTTWKVLFCMLLFFAADMVKVILAKIVAGHFHNQLHFSKMQDALNKVSHRRPDLDVVMPHSRIVRCCHLQTRICRTTGPPGTFRPTDCL